MRCLALGELVAEDGNTEVTDYENTGIWPRRDGRAMTLDTRIAIGGPYNAHEVFRFCRTLLGTPEHIEPRHGEGADHLSAGRAGQKMIGNPYGGSVSTWLQIWYGADGPMVHQCDELCPTEDRDDHDRWVADNPTRNGWAAIEVSFDTDYGYRWQNGESSSALHARLVTALGRWLDERGLPWKWRNAYTDEWFDRYEGLDEFEATERVHWAQYRRQ